MKFETLFKVFVGVTAVVFWLVVVFSLISVLIFPDPNEELRQYVKERENYLTEFTSEENQRLIDFVNEENDKLHNFVDKSNQDTIDQVNEILGY